MTHTETIITITDDTGVLEATVQGHFRQPSGHIHKGREIHFILLDEIPADLDPRTLTPQAALETFGTALAIGLAKAEENAIDAKMLLSADLPVRVIVDIGFTAAQSKSTIGTAIGQISDMIRNPPALTGG